MSRQSKRKAVAIHVPDLKQDAAERKRLLNVLAQRRYRERKREHLKKLESQHESGSSPSLVSSLGDAGAQNPTPRDQEPTEDPQTQPESVSEPLPDAIVSPGGNDVGGSSNTLHGLGDSFDLGSEWVPEPFEMSFQPWPMTTALPSLPNSPIEAPSIYDSSSGQRSDPSTPPSSTDSTNWPPIQDMDMGSALQTMSTKSYTFPDERYTSILELKLLHSCITIAKRLNIEDLLWDLTSTSPFTNPALAGLSFDHLPVNLRPTKTQQLIPHHPMFDILAWPTVRDKLILVFSQDPEFRPPTAATPTAMFDLVYDLEDSAEGVRIWGEDPCLQENWEVGEAVLKKWWWALDSNVIGTSNELRRQRGAPLLGEGFVVGEL